jgi:1-acyl-sn-glycerol-3-phosphate acyltransferase
MWRLKLAAFLFASLLFLCLVLLFRVITVGMRTLAADRIIALITSAWGTTMLFILNISVEVQRRDTAGIAGPKLFVSNHQSYVDIIVAASIEPMMFVAKKEVKDWTLLGWMAELGGTIFIDRHSFRGGLSATNELSQALRRKNSVHIFPEATSTDGSSVLPFKPMLFGAAVETWTAIQPMRIVYRSIDGENVSPINRDTVCWYGTMEFIPHFIRLLKSNSITAEVLLHPIIAVTNDATPRSLAEKSFAVIATG